MNAIHLAKRRAALRRHEGGAVMFIVAMMIAVLGSVGVYALAAAATEVRTSGNERQNTQTHYLAEYGIARGGASRPRSTGVAQTYHEHAQAGQAQKPRPTPACLSPACRPRPPRAARGCATASRCQELAKLGVVVDGPSRRPLHERALHAEREPRELRGDPDERRLLRRDQRGVGDARHGVLVDADEAWSSA